VVPRCVFSFLEGVSSFFLLGHFHGILNYTGFLTQALLIGVPFSKLSLKGRVCGYVQKPEAHALRCRP